ncbi:type II toxin-antitoxin system RelE/ParE family toxin [Pusillimonas noertemannii]|uniref:type II toxin-antitoxin system RelE/ParE family toxin n=1 Tax=Pusillimonas noertemannii TaxID=305977 RepID=UPI000A022CA3|nr:type II toxin-antitoxin system RelE/ParE family toxin [Pusillimonas noertemannii]
MEDCITWWYSCSKRIFRTRTFSRWMQYSGLTDSALRKAVFEMAQGLYDADLGSYVVKKRIALPGQGKRGGARTIVATKLAERWFFLYGLRKNERANIDQTELKLLQELAKEFLSFDDHQLAIAIALAAGEIVEISSDIKQT